MISVAQVRHKRDIGWIKQLIWAYFFLLIFEGALRKWILPAYAAPLLLMRDPIVIAAYVVAYKCRLFPRNAFISVAAVMGVVSLVISLFISRESPAIALYGFRTNFLQIPLIFLIAKAFDSRDVEKVGYWMLILSIPMALLMVFQFLSSPYAWINQGLNDNIQIASAMGRIRPPGTFSFISGPIFFYSLVAAFLLNTQFGKNYPTWLIVAATAATLCAVVVSGSRTLAANIGVVFLLGFTCCLFLRPVLALRWIGVVAVLAVGMFFLSSLSFFTIGLEVFTSRINNASNFEGGSTGFLSRVTYGFTNFTPELYGAPWLGRGLGMGTNVGLAMMVDKSQAIWYEDEWARHMLESGPILGLAFILYRVALTIWIGAKAVRHAARRDPLPILLFGTFFLTMLNGIISQTTILGFMVFLSGICLSATRVPKKTRVVDLQASSENSEVIGPREAVFSS